MHRSLSQAGECLGELLGAGDGTVRTQLAQPSSVTYLQVLPPGSGCPPLFLWEEKMIEKVTVCTFPHTFPFPIQPRSLTHIWSPNQLHPPCEAR